MQRQNHRFLSKGRTDNATAICINIRPDAKIQQKLSDRLGWYHLVVLSRLPQTQTVQPMQNVPDLPYRMIKQLLVCAIEKKSLKCRLCTERATRVSNRRTQPTTLVRQNTVLKLCFARRRRPGDVILTSLSDRLARQSSFAPNLKGSLLKFLYCFTLV